jgi:NADH:ubiquinone oxidoreductase subunit F (NADH-binding)
VLKNCGEIDPEDIQDYIQAGGFTALGKAMNMNPNQIIEEVKNSGIRGRGGAGFPAGVKWGFAKKASGDKKYLICNADEGDPGAFMDRSVLEGDSQLLKACSLQVMQ